MIRLARRLRLLLACAAAVAGAACTTLPPALPGDDCTRWFDTLDAAVDANGVRDAQDARIAGFAFVRVDRLGEAMRTAWPLAEWLAHAAALDERAREAELAQLPATAFPLDGVADAAAASARSRACRGRLAAQVAQQPTAAATLLERARVPDRYSALARTAGAYPLLRWPFFAGVQAWEREHAAAVARWNAAPPPRWRVEPPGDDPLAPVFEIEQRASDVPAHDRFGRPAWTARDAAAPYVDTSQPVVFHRTARARHGSRLLRQHVYTLWFPERPAAQPFDILAGRLDGVIVRITVDDAGRPLLLDTIHACGCWHQFYPAPGVSLRAGAPAATRWGEWAFVPAALPVLAAGERLTVRLASGTHHVTGIVATAPRADAARYRLHDEQALRALPIDGGGRRSLYGADGRVAGTERAERFLFWPMGIASAGAMRQWGHHATAFVGRRHFDDPDLLADRFELPAAQP